MWPPVPGSPLEPVGASFKDEAELVTLSVGNDYVLQLLHDRASAARHQAQGPIVIGLLKIMLLCKPQK